MTQELRKYSEILQAAIESKIELKEVKKDFLFIVPQKSYLLHKHIIRTVLWATESDKTYDVITGEEFIDRYSELSDKLLDSTIESQYSHVGDFGNLSTKEKEFFKRFMAAVVTSNPKIKVIE